MAHRPHPPIAQPRPPSERQITAWLSNRDRDADDGAERRAALVELEAAEAKRLARIKAMSL